MSELFISTERRYVVSNQRDDSETPSIVIPDSAEPFSAISAILDGSHLNAEAIQEQLWNSLEALYTSNESERLKADLAALGSSPRSGGIFAKKLRSILNTFVNHSDKLLDALNIIGSSHPILALVILPVREAVRAVVSRRDNNQKVVFVVFFMQNMLGPILQIRSLDRTHMPEKQRDFYDKRLKGLVGSMVKDVKICWSDITHFLDRKYLHKLILAFRYEKNFAGHVETFTRHRLSLQALISEYVAIGVSTANVGINRIDKKMDGVDQKLGKFNDKMDTLEDKADTIISLLFRNLDTQREKDVFAFFDQHKGVENCVNDLDVLPQLISKAGEFKSGNTAISTEQELEKIQKDLKKVLGENLDKILEMHLGRFENMLLMQNENLQVHLKDQKSIMQMNSKDIGIILDTVTTIKVLEEGKPKAKEVKFNDPEIQSAWTQLKPGSSVVKAKTFILTFRDHVRADISQAPSPKAPSVPLPEAGLDSGGLNSDILPKTIPSNNLRPAINSSRDMDEWVLEYIDVAHVQPLVEAMDEDGSGYISIKEANRFAVARPDGLSLLKWIAYWAAGWHMDIVNYQKEIYSVLLQMDELLPHILVTNRVYVDDYLDRRVMMRVEALLRSIRPLQGTAKKDPRLIEVAQNVANSQLERLKTNLNRIGYVIESSSHAKIVAVRERLERVETWILPLILLLLQRHRDVMVLAKTVVLDPAEFEVHVQSLRSVFAVFDERMGNLEAKFRQLYNDVDAQFQNFAYGMFYAAFKKTEFNTFNSILMSLKGDEFIYSDDGISKPDKTILARGLTGTLNIDSDEDDIAPAPLSDDRGIHPVEGDWFGWFKPHGTASVALHCIIHPVVDKRLVGQLETMHATAKLTGNIEQLGPQQSCAKFSLDFTISLSSLLRFQGKYDKDEDVIEGTFTKSLENRSAEDSQGAPKLANTDVVADIDLIDPGIIEAKQSHGNQTTTVESSNFSTDLPTGNLDASHIISADMMVADDEIADPRGTDEPVGKPVTLECTDELDGEDVYTTQPRVLVSNVASSPSSEEVQIIDATLDQPEVGPDPNIPIKANETVDEVVNNDREATDSDGDYNSEGKTADGHFRLERTHVHILKNFQSDRLGLPDPSDFRPARKRWFFATKAVLAHRQIWTKSGKAFIESLAERRKWLSYAIRSNLSPSHYGPTSKHITEEECDDYAALMMSLHPKKAQIYEEIAAYMIKRETYLIAVGRTYCDVCRYGISCVRYQCIICKDEDLGRGDFIDICESCIDKPVPIRNDAIFTFTHNKSHSLLRSPYRIHNYEFSSIIPQARLISERSKKMFRALAEKNKEPNVLDNPKVLKGKGPKNSPLIADPTKQVSDDASQPILCACCRKPVLPPCWVCIICSPLCFMCLNCESAKVPITQAEHSRQYHQILRIYDAVEVKFVRSKDVTDVARQLEDIRSNISSIEMINKQLLEELKGMAAKPGAEEEGEMEMEIEMEGEGDESREGDEEGTVGEGEGGREALCEDTQHGAPVVDTAIEVGDADVPDSDNLADDHERHVPTNPSTGYSSKRKTDNQKRLAALETEIKSIGSKVETLEAKIDLKFGALFDLVQNLVSSSQGPASGPS